MHTRGGEEEQGEDQRASAGGADSPTQCLGHHGWTEGARLGLPVWRIGSGP